MGRAPVTTMYQRLQIARAHFGNQVGYREIAELLHVPKSTACRNGQAVAADFPEFVKFLENLGTHENQFTLREQARKTLKQVDELSTEYEIEEVKDRVQGDLADMLETTIGHLLDMQPGELRAMRTEHKLRHIPELIKAMRLLREQSTENIAKISLTKAVGIATARQKPSE